MHGYESKRFPLTMPQSRVLFHAERILRSAGGPGDRAAIRWRALCSAAGFSPMVSDWAPAQCRHGLIFLEHAARRERMHLFRNISTDWGQIKC